MVYTSFALKYFTFPLQANEEEKSLKKEERRQETRKRKEKRSMKQLREQRRREATGDDKGRKEVWLLPGAAEDELSASDCKPMQEKTVSSSRINLMDEAEVHSTYILTTKAL